MISLSPRVILDRGRFAHARAVVAIWLMATACLVGAVPTTAGEITQDEARALFPEARGTLHLEAPSGAPATAAVTSDGKLVGYAFSTSRVTGSLGFAGRPLDVHVGLDLNGRITGAHLAAHEEPILVIGIPPAALERYVAGLAGIDIRQSVKTLGTMPSDMPDHVAGATVSSTVIKDAVLRSARAVAAARNLFATRSTAATIDRTSFEASTFRDLIQSRGVQQRSITRREAGWATPALPPLLDLYLALLSPPSIGENLLGRREYESLSAQLQANQDAILVAANGLYSFKGTAWRQSGLFDRFQLVQGALTIRFKAEDHIGIERLAADDAPDLREIGIFKIPPTAGFDPTRPWRIELTIEPESGTAALAPAMVAADYTLPERFLSAPRPPPGAAASDSAQRSRPAGVVPSAAEPELWEQIWRSRPVAIGLLLAMLAALAVILFSHDLLVRDVRRYRITRITFLAVTVTFLGFYAGAQLSVVHVLTFMHALLNGFHWEQFLLDPLIFILWSFVALALLFWGRGVFCGWLCPFGALQELTNEVARKIAIRQIELPWALHERLWPIKYVAFLLLLGISLKSTTQAFVLAEIEPFKTAIVMKFVRHWPFVIYVLALLAAGLCIERFYCRYLCPLGAALAIPARLRLFEWLKRRPQCGRECRICAATCTVQAINPIGQIVPNECIYCLQCQTNYYDASTCLPLIQRRQRRQATVARASSASTSPGDDHA